MSLNKGKHIVQEIDGVLCTLVESGLNPERVRFLSELLTYNQFEVRVAKLAGAEGQSDTFVLGVTDLVFNPVISVFGKMLRRPDGGRVSPSYWNQETEVDRLPYFDYRDKNPEAINEDDFMPNPWAYRTI